jgi:hypothetical protein
VLCWGLWTCNWAQWERGLGMTFAMEGGGERVAMRYTRPFLTYTHTCISDIRTVTMQQERWYEQNAFRVVNRDSLISHEKAGQVFTHWLICLFIQQTLAAC